jgi:hypothetical protein
MRRAGLSSKKCRRANAPLFVECRFKERQYGETPLSHGLPLTVEPGKTLDVVLGGSGRKVVGRVKVIGGDQSDVDWRRDVHKLTLVLPADGLPQPPDASKLPPEDRQKAWERFNQSQRAFWKTDAGRLRERAERTYVLVFETNGQFRVDHVPPGKYMLSIIANDPDEEYYRQRMIGSLNREIEVPAVAAAKVNEPFDVGTLELTIRGKLRIGKAVAPLETKSLDGTPIKLSDYRGKHVLLFFWSGLMPGRAATICKCSRGCTAPSAGRTNWSCGLSLDCVDMSGSSVCEKQRDALAAGASGRVETRPRCRPPLAWMASPRGC